MCSYRRHRSPGDDLRHIETAWVRKQITEMVDKAQETIVTVASVVLQDSRRAKASNQRRLRRQPNRGSARGRTGASASVAADTPSAAGGEREPLAGYLQDAAEIYRLGKEAQAERDRREREEGP